MVLGVLSCEAELKGVTFALNSSKGTTMRNLHQRITSGKNNVVSYLERRKAILALYVWLPLMFLLLGGSGTLNAQCNPAGNVSRYEFNITPLSTFNLIGQEFCTNQQAGNGCCSMQSGYRCLDIILNIANGPGGEQFSPSCTGQFTLMTEQSNFDALFFGVGAPAPSGNNVDCSTPIGIGNNHAINFSIAGNVSNQLVVTLSVIDNMGVTIFTATETTSAGESVIFTICKPGNGCVEDDFIFGCCGATASLDLAPGINDTICSGSDSALKITASNGIPPYTASVRAVTSVDTTILSFVVNDDNDGNPNKDTAIFTLSPSLSTQYYLLSIEDADGCAQAVSDTVRITVLANPVCLIDGLDTVCNSASIPVVYDGPAGMFDYNWTISGNGVIVSGADQQTVQVEPGAPGSFMLTLVVEDDFGCSSTCSKEVSVYDPALILQASSLKTVAVCGDTVTVSITASTAQSDIFSMQFGVAWDESELEYLSHTATPLFGSAPVVNVTSGALRYTWADLTVDGQDVNGLTLLSFTFRAVANAGVSNVDVVEFLPGFPFEVFSDPDLFCSGSIIPQNNVSVGLSPINVNCPAAQTVCADAPAFVLPDGDPAGGMHSGPGVGAGNVFSPQLAGLGVHVITYALTNQFGCKGSCTYTISVNEPASVQAGSDVVICQNQAAVLNAVLSGSAVGGNWSGGAGQFANSASAFTTYTPAPSEYGATVQLVFTTNDPAGPCPADTDTIQITVNTLPIVNAGPDKSVCAAAGLNLTQQGASIQANGSGISTGFWSTGGSGTFQPTNAFPGALTYIPSQADKNAGFVVLTLTSADPAGPCSPVSDAMLLTFEGAGGMVCNDTLSIALGVTGMYMVGPDDILEGTYDYNLYTVQLFKNSLPIGNKVDCSHLGMYLRAVVTNICNGNSCSAVVQIVDNLPPQAICTDITLSCIISNFDPNYLFNTLNITQAFPATSDNCTVTGLTHVDTWVTLPCDASFNGQTDLSGYVRRLWTVSDQGGLKDTCIQYIYFKRNHIEDVFFPQDTVLSCENAVTEPAVTGAPFVRAFSKIWPLWPDNGFCDLQLTYADQVLQGCGASRTILRTWTIYDPCRPTSSAPPNLNPLYYVQSIVIVDTVGPVFQCPADLTVNTNPNDCLGTVNLPDVTIEDACSPIELIRAEYTLNGLPKVLNGSLTTFPGNNLNDPDTLGILGVVVNLPLGVTVFQYVVADVCDNNTTCSFKVTVEDQTPPQAVCDEITQVALGINGMALIDAFTFDDGSYDNCAPLIYKARRVESNGCQDTDFFLDRVKFCCEDINDTILVIMRVYDVSVPAGPVSLAFAEDNSNECLVQVYVEDKIKPVCTPPANVTVSCENFDPSLWAYGFAQGADNCCVDTVTVNTNYGLFDTICSRGTIQRTFRVADCNGQSSQCAQRIVVQYEQDYFIRFPNDVIVTDCDGSGVYGEPQIFGEDCELLAISRQDVVFTSVPNACYKVERTWRIINWCTYDPNFPITQVPNPNPNPIDNHVTNLTGPVVSPNGTPAPWTPTIAKLSPNDPVATNFSQFWNAGANGYEYKQVIKVIDNVPPIIGACPNNPTFCDLSDNNAQLWNAPYWFDPLIGSQDLCEGEANLAISATDLCSGSNLNVRYLLFLDTDYDNVMETVVSSTNLPGYNTIFYGNANTPNYSGGTPRAFDQRPVSLNQKYGFALQTAIIGNQLAAFVRWNTASAPNTFIAPQLPYGLHKIKWFISDGCGNETVCEYTFLVKDCKAPTVVCKNGLSVNIAPGGTITLYAPDFLLETTDNCTPSDQLILGIVESDESNGSFPIDTSGLGQFSVTFDCTELGSQPVELWSRDKQGNAAFCETYVIVQDNHDNCSSNQISVAGALKTEQQAGLEGASLELTADHPLQPAISLFANSNQQGGYVFSNALPFASTYTVTPWMNEQHANGVTTYDLVLISKHILGLEPLGSPYKMIAADANKSNSITTFDIFELRKLILGIYSELPDVSSWRFVDKDYQFTDPFNPFAMPFPESKSELNVQGSLLDNDFVALKVGDVNGSVIANSLTASEERNARAMIFDVQTLEGAQTDVQTAVSKESSVTMLKAGQTYTILFNAAEAAEGFQFTLNYKNMEVLKILHGADMTTEHFALFPDAVTCSFNSKPGSLAGKQMFALVIHALRDAPLNELITLSNRITRSEAYVYTAEAEKCEIALRFQMSSGATVSGVGFEAYQNTPNPFVHKTTVGFHLPERADVRIEIFDENGRLLHTQEGIFDKGFNRFVLDGRTIDASGILYCKLSTEQYSASMKMIKIN